MYAYLRLTPETALPYAGLTIPAYRALLDTAFDTLVVVGAAYFWQPVGLAIATLTPDNRYAQVVSLVVLPEHRRKGVGTALLAEVEKQLQERGCHQADFAYLTETDNTAGIERLLQKQDWRPPQTVAVFFESDVDTYLKSPLYTPQVILPDGYEFFAWADLTPADRAAILQRQAQTPGGWFSDTVSPFIQEERMEPINSIGLRYQGAVVGWMVTQRMTNSLIDYTNLFVSREHKGQSLSILLVMEATRRQFEYIKANGQEQTATSRSLANSKWTKMLLDFAGGAFKIQEQKVATKMLQAKDADPIITLLTRLPDHFN
jgi:GNAT superfamily N-acetyltransferase